MARDTASARTLLGVGPADSATEITRAYLQKVEPVNRQIDNAASPELRAKFLDQRTRLERALEDLLTDLSEPGRRDEDLPSDVLLSSAGSALRAASVVEPDDSRPPRDSRWMRRLLFGATVTAVMFMAWMVGLQYTLYHFVVDPICDKISICQSYRQEAEQLKAAYISNPARVNATSTEEKYHQGMDYFNQGNYFLSVVEFGSALRNLRKDQLWVSNRYKVKWGNTGDNRVYYKGFNGEDCSAHQIILVHFDIDHFDFENNRIKRTYYYTNNFNILSERVYNYGCKLVI